MYKLFKAICTAVCCCILLKERKKTCITLLISEKDSKMGYLLHSAIFQFRLLRCCLSPLSMTSCLLPAVCYYGFFASTKQSIFSPILKSRTSRKPEFSKPKSSGFPSPYTFLLMRFKQILFFISASI